MCVIVLVGKAAAEKKKAEKNLVHAKVILNKMCGWTADASESEQAKFREN